MELAATLDGKALNARQGTITTQRGPCSGTLQFGLNRIDQVSGKLEFLQNLPYSLRDLLYFSPQPREEQDCPAYCLSGLTDGDTAGNNSEHFCHCA